MNTKQLLLTAPLVALAACAGASPSIGSPSAPVAVSSPAPATTEQPAAPGGPAAINDLGGSTPGLHLGLVNEGKRPPALYGLDRAFVETGLQPGEVVAYSVTAEAVFSYSCGGSGKTTIRPLSFQQPFTADASGTISGRVSMRMAMPACEGGGQVHPWTFEIRNGILTDSKHGLTVALPGSLGQFD